MKKGAWRGFKRVSGERCWFCWNTDKDVVDDDDDDDGDVNEEVVVCDGVVGGSGGGGGGCQNQRRRKFATLFGLEIGRLLAFETIGVALKRLTMVEQEMRLKQNEAKTVSARF